MNPDKINQRKQLLRNLLGIESLGKIGNILLHDEYKKNKKIWNDLMMETLGISNNLLFDYGVFDCLWNIVLEYLEINIPKIKHGPYMFDIGICNICDLKLNRIIENSRDIGTFTFIIEPNFVDQYIVCFECIKLLCKDIGYIRRLESQRTSIQTIKKASSLVRNMCVIDFISIKYKRHDRL